MPRKVAASMPHTGRHRLGREILDLRLERLEPGDVGLDVLLVVELLLDDRVDQRIQHRHVAARLEAQRIGGMTHQILAARIDDDQLGAALGRLLEVGRSDRMVGRRTGADHHDAIRLQGIRERRRHRTGADAFHQRCDRRGMAEPGAVIDVVGPEAAPHQLLEQVSLLVGALGRAEAGQRLAAVRVVIFTRPDGGALHRLIPGRLAEDGQRIDAAQVDFARLRRIVAPDQRPGQPLGRHRVVEAEAALDAEARFSLAKPLRPSTWTILLSLTATLVWQPTPQNGQTVSTTLSKL